VIVQLPDSESDMTASIIAEAANKAAAKDKSNETADNVSANSLNNNPAKKASKKFKYDKPMMKLGDYWFLHNPRKAGCEYSYGRADWGCPDTLPPESSISTKSDIWGLGICIYNWLTLGLYPNLAIESIDDLRTHIPLKWEPWLHSLILMCLQPNPKHRASTDQIINFLSITHAKM
jgi:serine/threonine protein kinase